MEPYITEDGRFRPDVFRRYEAPLLDIDPVLDAFAAERGGKVLKHHQNAPDRLVVIPEGNWTVTIGISLLTKPGASEEAGYFLYNVWVWAKKDTPEGRFYGPHRVIGHYDSLPTDAGQAERLLQQCWRVAKDTQGEPLDGPHAVE